MSKVIGKLKELREAITGTISVIQTDHQAQANPHSFTRKEEI